MIIIAELKVNKFEEVTIPRASDLFKQVGPRTPDKGSYSGDESLDPSKSKVAMAKEVAKEVSEQPVEEEV